MEALLKRLQNGIKLNLNINQILNISYEYSDPDIALSVVATVVELFVEDLLGTNRTDTESAQEFIIEKIEEYEKQLMDTEAQLSEM